MITVLKHALAWGLTALALFGLLAALWMTLEAIAKAIARRRLARDIHPVRRLRR